ncbi:MAG: response regulator [Planctomycetes bacterium]|nr:response regulator [Planctomycetota bacterium]
MKILIVDDDVGSSKLLQLYLSEYGDLVTANSGAEAVELFEQSLDNNERFDLICLDFMMPGMDGIETLEAIRQMERQRGIARSDRVRVIMTTVVDQEENILKAFATGCDSYVIRPDRKERLVDEIRNFGLIS